MAEEKTGMFGFDVMGEQNCRATKLIRKGVWKAVCGPELEAYNQQIEGLHTACVCLSRP